MAIELEPGAGVKLNEAAMAYLSQRGEERSYAAGDTIHKDAADSSFYVVLEGTAEVQLVSENGLAMPMGKLSAGATFGVTNILQRKPSSGTVVALTPVRVLRYPGEQLQVALRESDDVRSYVIARMANTLQQTRQEAWNFFRRSHAFDLLLASRQKSGQIIAHSPAMRVVEARIPELAAKRDAVLIVGQSGTGRAFVAGKLHELSVGKNAPFTVFECGRTTDEGEENKVLFGSSRFAEGSSETADYGAVHLADGGTVLLRNVEKLNRHSQRLLAKYLAHRKTTGDDVFPNTRVIATTSENLTRLAQDGAFDGELAALLRENMLALPSLANRKKDLLPLAEEFLRARGDGKKLAADAAAKICSLRYSDRNVSELRNALELAALFTKGDEIAAEHIWTAPEDQTNVMEFDLSRFKIVRKLLRPDTLRAVRFVVFVGFVVAILFGLVAGHSWLRIISSGLVWAIWEPLLILTIVGVGRLWCTVCPLCLPGEKIQSLGYSLQRPVPAWMKRFSPWIMTGGFFVIVIAESVLLMSHTPAYTSLLLITLVVLAIITSMIYQRQVWCRYLCPLGGLVAAYSATSSLRVKANTSICTNYCTTHDCLSPTKRGPGCPVFHHPLHLGNVDECKMCMGCLTSCPHGSARLHFRPTLQGIWNMGVIGHNMRLFTACLFTFSIVMMSSSGYAWSTTATGLLGSAAVALGLGAILNIALERSFADEATRDPSIVARILYALAVLAWGPLMAHQFQNMPWFGELHVHATEGGFLSTFLHRDVTLAGVFEAVVIVFAVLMWVFCFGMIRGRLTRLGVPQRSRRWVALYGLGLVYALSAVAVLIKRAGG